jgi:hypothetical protein
VRSGEGRFRMKTLPGDAFDILGVVPTLFESVNISRILTCFGRKAQLLRTRGKGTAFPFTHQRPLCHPRLRRSSLQPLVHLSLSRQEALAGFLGQWLYGRDLAKGPAGPRAGPP